MLPTNIDEVGPEHITGLVADRIEERKRLEYKEQLPGGSDGAAKEFLADVCSFANAEGGDIIYGIRDARDDSGQPTGRPDSIVGLASGNLAEVRHGLEARVRDGISPRIPNIQSKVLEGSDGKAVLLFRVTRSWLKPHMVVYKGTSRFYSRHSTGKYQLDVQEIGEAFASQRSLGERLRNWRTDRVARLLSDEAPARLGGRSKLLIHFVPASALVGQELVGLWPVPSQVRNTLRPSSLSSSGPSRYNADGFLVHSLTGTNGSDAYAYAQLFRNGSLEYGDGYILNVGNTQGHAGAIPSRPFEQKLVETFENALLALSQLGIGDPIYFSCTLVGVQGLRLSREAFLPDFDAQYTFDRQVVQTPDIQIERMEAKPYRNSVLPIVDSIWQASGYERTPWRNAANEWTP